MGNCFSILDFVGRVRSRPLLREVEHWQTDVGLTFVQLMEMRDAFWNSDLGGDPEVWKVLKLVAEVVEAGNYDLAELFLDVTSIATPTGSLRIAYDKQGNNYHVPIFCLSIPVNLLSEEHFDEDYIAANAKYAEDLKVHDLKVRTSITGNERVLRIQGFEPIWMGKKKLARDHSGRQRWYFSGKLLDDRKRIKDLKIPAGFIIQVVINPIEDSY